MKKLTMQQLLTEIKSANSPVGASFLSSQLSVPPATIGRLLKSAEEQGYLEQVSNKGRILTKAGDSYLSDCFAQTKKLQVARDLVQITESADLHHLIEVLEFRKLIEPHNIAIACQVGTEEDLEELKVYDLERRYQLTQGNPSSDADLRFHLKFAELSGNHTIYHVLKLLLMENNVYACFTAMNDFGETKVSSSHDDILEAFGRRDSDAAAQAMTKHLDELLQAVENYARQHPEEAKRQ